MNNRNLEVTTNILDYIGCDYTIELDYKNREFIHIKDTFKLSTLDSAFSCPNDFLSYCRFERGISLSFKIVGKNFMKGSYVNGGLHMDNLTSIGDNFLKDCFVGYHLILPKLKSVGKHISNRYINGSLILSSLEYSDELKNIIVVGDLDISNIKVGITSSCDYFLVGGMIISNHFDFIDEPIEEYLDSVFKYIDTTHSNKIIDVSLDFRKFNVIDKLNGFSFIENVYLDCKNKFLNDTFLKDCVVYKTLIIDNFDIADDNISILKENIKLQNKDSKIVLNYDYVIDYFNINNYKNVNEDLIEINGDVIYLKKLETYIKISDVSELSFFKNQIIVQYSAGNINRHIVEVDDVDCYKFELNKALMNRK